MSAQTSLSLSLITFSDLEYLFKVNMTIENKEGKSYKYMRNMYVHWVNKAYNYTYYYI